MVKAIANVDTEVLVEVVRLVQKLGLKGVKGGWKDFLNSLDPKLGSSLSDPAKRSRDTLIAFLESCQWKNRKFISRLVGRFSSQRAVEQFTKEFQDQEFPHQRLVRMTFEHPQYKQHYSFPSLDEEWILVTLGKIIEAMKSKNMIAVDCEMVGCEDGTEAVVRVCAVDQTLKVIIDEKVHPGKAIANYRTEITGIAADDLEGVTCSLRDIQKSLKRLLAHGTILIGHSLHNDLQALKTDHLRVIDTSYIFKCKDLPISYTPSLNNLCEAILGYKIRKEGEAHDCRNDALAAMKLVLAKLGQGSDDPIAVPAKNVSGLDRAKLLLHKIPVNTSCKELRNVFPLEYSIDIQPDLRVRNQFYSTFAIFKDAGEVDAAFRQIVGHENKDLCGRLQKLVSLKLGTGQTINFHIRKMEADAMINGSELSKKRSAVEEDNRDSKRQQIFLHKCEYAKEMEAKQISLHQCGHAKEIKTLKQKLQEREDEIFTLQKMLSVLTEKHEL